MALNDAVLADVGFIDPVTATVVASVVSQFISFGPTQEFQERQAYRDAKDEIVSKYKAIMPSLKDWQRAIVSKDLDEFVYRMTRDRMGVSDYKAAMAWFAGREVAWQSMAAPERAPEVGFEIEPGMTASDLRRRIYEGTLRQEAAARGVTEPIAVGVTPSAVVPQEAGFNLPVLLVVGGVLAWLLLGKK